MYTQMLLDHKNTTNHEASATLPVRRVCFSSRHSQRLSSPGTGSGIRL